MYRKNEQTKTIRKIVRNKTRTLVYIPRELVQDWEFVKIQKVAEGKIMLEKIEI